MQELVFAGLHPPCRTEAALADPGTSPDRADLDGKADVSDNFLLPMLRLTGVW